MSSEGALRDLWDPITDLVTRALGGNTHFGYWNGPAYADRVGEATDRLTDLVITRLAVPAGSRVVDIGCGSGRPASRIAAATGAYVTGVTASHAQFAAACPLATREARLSFCRGPLDHLRFPDAAFDRAVMIDTLLFQADRDATLAEAARVLRPGGQIVIADICMRESLNGPAVATTAALERAFGLAPVPDMQNLCRLLSETGMGMVAIEDIGDRVRPSYTILAAALRTAEGLPPAVAARLAASAKTVAEFGAQPQTGYAVLTAERR